MRFGRLERRFHEARGEQIVAAIEQATGVEVPAHLSQKLERGADEFDLARSGLDDSMRSRAGFTLLADMDVPCAKFSVK